MCKLQFSPRPGQRAHTQSAGWPRLFAQMTGSRDVIELNRGPNCASHLGHELAHLGTGWTVWLENHLHNFQAIDRKAVAVNPEVQDRETRAETAKSRNPGRHAVAA